VADNVDNGDVYVAGDNSRGQLGVGGGVGSAFQPMRVFNLSNVVDVGVSGNTTYARTGECTLDWLAGFVFAVVVSLYSTAFALLVFGLMVWLSNVL
jgi:hypothetical protein